MAKAKATVPVKARKRIGLIVAIELDEAETKALIADLRRAVDLPLGAAVVVAQNDTAVGLSLQRAKF